MTFTASLARRLLLSLAVLAAVSLGSFVVIATKFTSTCTSKYSPSTPNAQLAGKTGQAALLWADWVKGIPSGKSFGFVCEGQALGSIGPALTHTAALLAATGLIVLILSLGIGTLAAAKAGSALDIAIRCMTYAAWSVPPFVLALMLQSAVRWATYQHGIGWLPFSGWPGSCIGSADSFSSCGPADSAMHHIFEVARHLVLPAVTLSVAFVALHSRYLRSSLLVALSAPYTVTARAKGLPESAVVLRHALRNSLATFVSAFLLDFGAIFGAAMAVDYVFQLNGFGTLLLLQLSGGGGEGARLNPYAIETLLTAAAVLVIAASFMSELIVGLLDPRMRAR